MKKTGIRMPAFLCMFILAKQIQLILRFVELYAWLILIIIVLMDLYKVFEVLYKVFEDLHESSWYPLGFPKLLPDEGGFNLI